MRRGLELYWRAYSELTTCRPASFGGLLPVPWTAIDRYAERYGFDDDQFEWLVYICDKLDTVMSKHSEKKE